MCWHSLCALPEHPRLPWGWQRDSKTAPVVTWGQPEAELQPGTPLRPLSGSGGGCPLRGSTLGSGASKIGPAGSRDPKGTGPRGDALASSVEPCQPPAGPRQLPWGCASTRDTHPALAGDLRQHPAAVGHGEGYPVPWVAPLSLSPRPPGLSPSLRACAAGASARALGSVCPAPGEAGMKGLRTLQPSPAVLLHLQSLRSLSKPGRAPGKAEGVAEAGGEEGKKGGRRRGRAL